MAVALISIVFFASLYSRLFLAKIAPSLHNKKTRVTRKFAFGFEQTHSPRQFQTPVLLKNRTKNKNSYVISSVKLSSLNELDRSFLVYRHILLNLAGFSETFTFTLEAEAFQDTQKTEQTNWSYQSYLNLGCHFAV